MKNNAFFFYSFLFVCKSKIKFKYRHVKLFFWKKLKSQLLCVLALKIQDYPFQVELTCLFCFSWNKPLCEIRGWKTEYILFKDIHMHYRIHYLQRSKWNLPYIFLENSWTKLIFVEEWGCLFNIRVLRWELFYGFIDFIFNQLTVQKYIKNAIE